MEPTSPFDRVLCGIDASGAGLDAVRAARRLAPPTSDFLLVGVSESHLATRTGMFASHAVEEIESDVRRALDEAQAFAGAVEARFVRGRADESLLTLAAETSATLLAVGTHEHGRAAGVLLGSVATRLLHDAPCSVLVARAGVEPGAFPRSIVAGVDGSTPSLWAAAVAQDVGTRLGVTVRLVAAGGAGPLELDLAALEESGLTVEHAESKPVDALLEATAEADLVVVGSRGVRGLKALGSVSERVAHQATCSVLVLRSAA